MILSYFMFPVRYCGLEKNQLIFGNVETRHLRPGANREQYMEGFVKDLMGSALGDGEVS